MGIFQGVFGLLALVIITAIIFVKAGQFGNANGGQQSAQILKAAGGAGSELINALEGSGQSGQQTYYN